MQGRSKLGGLNETLSQDVVVLEELVQSDAVTLYDFLYFLHEISEFLVAVEVEEACIVGRFSTGERLVHSEGQWFSAVSEEFIVPNFVVLVAVDEGNEVNFLLREWQSVSG